ncbi:uncharacterized protein ACR2FA_005824 [Aphomia sociella]
MKLAVLAFTLLLAGASALPSLKVNNFAVSDEQKLDARLIEGIVADLLQDIIDQIIEAGLDPLEIDALQLEYKLPVTNLLNINARAENILLTGLSDIVINNINYAILTGRVTFDVSLPPIAGSVGDSALDISFFGFSFTGSLSGSIAIVEPRVQGEIRISIGVISGISVRSLAIDFSLRDIESNLNLNILGVDYSELVNTILGSTIPTTIAEHRRDINELLEYIVWLIIDEVL